MKKIFVVFSLLLTSLACHAQHFIFMGIPIDGSIDVFDSAVKAKGFVSSKEFGAENTDRDKFYDGIFAGYDVSLLVRATPRSKIVYSVTAFKNNVSEKEGETMCQYVQETIEEKYDVNKKIVKGDYDTRYDVSYGHIFVQFRKEQERVYIEYIDNVNSKILDSEKRDDI